MRRGFILFIFFALTNTFVLAQDTQVFFENVYAYPSAKTQKNGAVFMTIKNTGQTDVRIVKATSDIAEKVELHTHTMKNDVMMMREVDGYDVKAGKQTLLEPMGHHIMLIGLKRQLVKGENFPLSLHRLDGKIQTVTVSVKNK